MPFRDLDLPMLWEPDLYARLLAIPGGMRRVRAHAAELGVVLSDQQQSLLRDCKQRHYLDRLTQGLVGWRPGVVRLTHRAHEAGLQQWIVTSSGRASVNALLETATERLPRFEGIISAESVSEGKPSAEGYLLALNRSGLPSDDVIVIEDSAAGLLAARAAGLACVLTPSPWDAELTSLLPQAVAVHDHLGDRNQPASQMSGPPCADGIVTLEFLQSLLHGTAG